MQLEYVDPLGLSDWDAQVQTLPGATFFHSRAWTAVLRETYGFENYSIAARDEGRLVGVVPLMEASSWLRGRRGIALPFSDHCGPLAATERVLRLLYARVIACGHDRGWRHVEIRGGARQLGIPPSISYHRHVLDLRGDLSTVAARMPSSTGRAIRKAERSGVTVEISGDLCALREFYGLYCLTRQTHGAPPSPWRFFTEIHRQILSSANGCVLLARQGGEAVAGAVFFTFGRTALFKFGASNPAALALRGNNLLLWRALEWFAQQGYETVDFGRTSLANEGLRRFKASFGATEEQVDYVRVDCRTEQFVTCRDATGEWPVRILRRLPRWTLRLIGHAAYRHFA